MPAGSILLQAAVGAEEARAVRRAAELIGSSLEGAIDVEVSILDGVEAMAVTAPPRLLVTSLLGDAEDPVEPWADCERRVRDRYGALAEDPGLIVYVCTVFRHVAGRSAAADRARLRRIRRLDLLAADLSREMGLLVIDLDRALADLGGATLATDWRLGGPHAAEACAGCLARVVVETALDGVVSAASLDAAVRALALRPAPAAGQPVERPIVIGGGGVPVRSRAGRQSAEVLPGVRGAELYLRAVIDGTVPLADAAAALRMAIARRGLARTAHSVLGAVGARLARRPAGPARSVR
jgi:hypothetical protein